MSTPGASPRFAQLPLGIRLRASASFDNFHAGANRDAVGILTQALRQGDETCIYLWGGPGSGKTHLLQAACHAAAARGATLAYLPFSELEQLSPAILEGLEGLPLIVLDDIDRIAGEADWETALFHLYNRVREAGGQVLISARANPASLPLSLPDLRSRLAWGVVLQLHELSDEDKGEALRLQARQRGMEMPAEVAAFLLRHCPRELHALFAVLDLLDHASLAAQRKLTVPFVKSVLESQV